ncbi:MAG: HD-GYP domain-containing protein [Firmicutes bacterium]|nr:HD-GYP domain-containing protein [Bacillota bacterium]
MRLVSIDNAKNGMVIARNIFTSDGNILLGKGKALTEDYIFRLEQWNINSLYIEDEIIGEIEIDELVNEQTKVETIRITKEAMNNIRNGKMMNSEKVRKAVNNIMEELIQNRKVIVNLVDIRAMNDFTFGHSVEVCILSLLTGIDLGYNFPKLKQLGYGALLHDVGKSTVSETLLYKKTELTPEERKEIEKHARLGYEILQKQEEISSVSAHVAWQHHERYDGSGYPRGIKGAEIQEFARVVALADAFDAMTTDRVYREKKVMPHEALEYLRDTGGTLFDPEIVKVFIQNIAPFPTGSIVSLNTGEKAVVTKVSKDFPSRPEIRIIQNSDGQRLTEPMEKDLRKELTVFIVGVLDEIEAGKLLSIEGN